MQHEKYMREAIELAKLGIGRVNPNPLVGAIIVKDDVIIGRGYHDKYGGNHAEVNAFLDCNISTEGATLYVTLEPCCHFGKTPPCVNSIIKNKIRHVVVGITDTNEKVCGNGIESLRKNGVEVTVGVLREECYKLNEIFFHYMKHKVPFVLMKYAMTIDGKIATVSNESRWITGELAREDVHMDRQKYSAIMVGIGTVIEDDPMLDCRVSDGTNPIRIICDTNLRTPLDSKIAKTSKDIRTIIATNSKDKNLHDKYIKKGIEILVVSKNDNFINLNELMELLGEIQVDSILLEGGSSLNFSALQLGIVDKVKAYIAPKIFGGDIAKTPVGGVGFEKISDCITLKTQKIEKFGEDILIESEVIKNVHRNN